MNCIVLCHAQTLSVEIKAKSMQEDKILHFKDFMKVQQIGYLLKVATQSTKYDLGRAFFSHLRPQYIRKDTKK